MKLSWAAAASALVALFTWTDGALLRAAPQVLTSSGPAHSLTTSLQNGTGTNFSFSAVTSAGSASKVNASLPFSARSDASVGKVWALYYSSYAGHKATSVEATTTYKVGSRTETPWHQGAPLPVPSCALQLRTQTNYPTDNREANLRLAEISVCKYLAGTGGSFPGCGASDSQVCELSLMVPAPSDDTLFEPHNAAAMALVAYSRLCAMTKNAYEQDQCAIHSSEKALLGGLQPNTALASLPSSGFIDLKMDAAYELGFSQVVLPSASESDFHESNFYHDSSDVLKWSRQPPSVSFCGNFACVVQNFMR